MRSSEEQSPGELPDTPRELASLSLGYTSSSVPIARQFVRDVTRMERHGNLTDAVEVAVSELVANAVLHTREPLDYRVRLSLLATSTAIRVEVHDAEQRAPRRRCVVLADLSGRGLQIVEAISAKWGFVPNSRGKCVWCEIEPFPEMTAEPNQGKANSLFGSGAGTCSR